MLKVGRKLISLILAGSLLLALTGMALATVKSTTGQNNIIETPGVLLARSLGLDDGTEVIALSSGLNEKGSSMIFALYADAADVFSADAYSPVYMKNIGIAAVSTTGKVVKLDGIMEGGYTPSMVNVGLDGEDELGAYMLVSAPTGGSGGTSTFRLMRYYKGAWSELLGEDFSLPINGYLNNYFRATIRVPDAKLYFAYGLSEGEKTTLMASGNYQSDGRLLKRDDAYFWTDGFVTMTPMISGGEMILLAQETVYAGYHANAIAQISANYRLNEDGTGLELYSASVHNMEEKLLATTK